MKEFVDIERCVLALAQKRKAFHAEADFQFALSWEIQTQYPDAHIRLEYHMKNFPNMHIDIMVFVDDEYIPIELKYKTAKLTTVIDGEPYNLKNHGAQDLGKYDYLKDVQRLELLAKETDGYHKGYAIWLTNDPSYLSAPKRANTVYEQFSVHDGAVKHGTMCWLPHASLGTIRNRETPITLANTYTIKWKPYSSIECAKGNFYYAIIPVES